MIRVDCMGGFLHLMGPFANTRGIWYPSDRMKIYICRGSFMKRNIIVALLACVAPFSIAKINIHHDVKAEQNRRPYQEDRFIYEQIKSQKGGLKKPGITFVGVYDGHGGDKTSSHLQKNLHNYFDECLGRTPNIKNALEGAFEKAENYALENFEDGSTAVVACVEDNDDDQDVYLHCAWAGDSRLVLDNGFATEDHKPDRADERARIENAWGAVYMDGVWRVNGLAVSRSIGDRRAKNGGGALRAKERIIATPEYAKIKLTPANKFFVIASDGLWDVMDNSSVINLVKERFQTTDDLGAIAQSLIDEAKNRKSGDNITVSVVTFDHHKKEKTSH